MKILSAAQIRALDAITIREEPISSIDLMERASQTFVDWFTEQFQDEDQMIYIFCGIGNNGGDGLAIARLLHQKFYSVQLYWCKISLNSSTDFALNFKRLPKRKSIPLQTLKAQDTFPKLESGSIIIDAIFGSGLNRPVEGYWAQLIDYINGQQSTIISVDIPSGLFADQHTDSTSVCADYTFSFELPKLAFVFPENQDRVGKWLYQSIGLNQAFQKTVDSPFYYIDHNLAKTQLSQRQKFDHKGTYGHALLMVGSYGKVGAGVLAARACLRSGVGLLTVHSPTCAYEILQISVPEAMVNVDKNEHYLSELPILDRYQAIGIGCGIDKQAVTANALKALLENSNVPLLLDADALNLISENPEWLARIPKDSILTPHPKEFERLFGKSTNHFEQNEIQRKKAEELGIFIILKGANTAIACPDGSCYFNSTGNPGMATAGSGDVLSGIITGLMAQSYSSFQACVLGVYLHGLAGDFAAEELGQVSMLAGDIINSLGISFKTLQL